MNVLKGFGMRRRLLLAQTLVLVAGGVTTWVVASLVGPPLFREHLHQAGVAHDSNEQYHAEQAYQHATALSIAVAITVAALTALVVTVFLSRRLQGSIAEVSAAASEIAEGRYDVRVASPGLGDEFDDLADAFNKMAERLQSVESTRRQLFGDLAHEIRTPVAVLEAYLEAVEDGVKTLDPPTIAVLREQTGRLVRFSADAAALAQAEEAHATIAPTWVEADGIARTAAAAMADRYTGKNVALNVQADKVTRLWRTANAWPRSPAICWTTRSDTRLREDTSPSASPTLRTRWCSVSPMTGTASRPSDSRMSSSASIARTSPGTAGGEARASGWRS